MCTPALTHPTRLLISILSSVMLLSLVACANLNQQTTTPVTTRQFAVGWQDHSRALIHLGPGRSIGTTDWLVPAILANGNYRVINHQGNTADLIDGYQFKIDNNPQKEIHLFLPSVYSEVEALDEKYILNPVVTGGAK